MAGVDLLPGTFPQATEAAATEFGLSNMTCRVPARGALTADFPYKAFPTKGLAGRKGGLPLSRKSGFPSKQSCDKTSAIV